MGRAVPTFGRTLLARGAISESQLDEATQWQVVFGGRLGTNLVELGHLDLDALERHLAEHLGLPLPPREWVERPDPEALALLPPEAARRHRALPLRREAQVLHAALLDPAHPGPSDDLAFATGLRVRPYVMAELRLDALREHYYGIPRETRGIPVEEDAWLGPRPQRAPPGEGPVLAAAYGDPVRAALGIGPLDEGQELIDERTFASLHTAAQRRAESEAASTPAAGAASADAPPAEPASAAPAAAEPVSVLEPHLTAAPDREAVTALALAIARRLVPAAALFVVRGGVACGLRGDGGRVPLRLDGILLSLESDCMLTRAACGRAVRQTPPRGGLDARLLEALGRSEAHETLVLPVTIGGRAVNLLYADAGAAPLGDVAPAALAALCGRMAAAYERLIRERKRVLARAGAAV